MRKATAPYWRSVQYADVAQRPRWNSRIFGKRRAAALRDMHALQPRVAAQRPASRRKVRPENDVERSRAPPPVHALSAAWRFLDSYAASAALPDMPASALSMTRDIQDLRQQGHIQPSGGVRVSGVSELFPVVSVPHAIHEAHVPRTGLVCWRAVGDDRRLPCVSHRTSCANRTGDQANYIDR